MPKPLAALLLALGLLVAIPQIASAQTPGPVDRGSPVVTTPAPPTSAVASTSKVSPTAPKAPATPGTLNISLADSGQSPSQSVLIILLLTVLSVAPAGLIMLTSFTRIIIVLSLTRQALGLQGVPPNQVLAGLALFLSLFVMAPTLSRINDDAIQPLLNDKIDTSQAWDNAQKPLREFMLKQTRKGELEMFVSAEQTARPATPDDVKLTALIPAFVLSELKTAFIIGFIIFIPFLVIDIVVGSSLMSMGMMMLPPSLVSMPFKLLLFVMVDGWGLIVTSLLSSFTK